GNLSWNVREDALNEFFSQVGNVASAQVLTDRETGRSRGFGFVEMSTDEEAQRAMQELNGKELDGREIVVNEAREREERGPRPNFGGGRGGFQRDHRGGRRS